MQTSIITSVFILSGMTLLAQPQFMDAPSLGEKDMVITVIESTQECNAEPGVYQLANNGYSKVVGLEALPEEHPEEAMTRNSAKVLAVLQTIGSESFEVRDYREFWIDECSKQSQYVLVERDNSAMSALLMD